MKCIECSGELKHMNKNYYICQCNLIQKLEDGKLVEHHQLGEDISDDNCVIDEIMNYKGTD